MNPSTPCIFKRAETFGARTAISTSQGDYTYGDLLDASGRIAAGLLQGRSDLDQERVCFLAPRGFSWTALQWGIWRAGGIAVPLSELHPQQEMEYVVRDSQAAHLVTHPDFQDRMQSLADASQLPLSTKDQLLEIEKGALPTVDLARRAMIFYTSGTTGKPKGVVSTHANLEAQINALVEAWGWSRDDRILHVLPLHHVHGIINALSCALYAGACCEFLPRFDAEEVWRKFVDSPLTIFMAVPTIYVKLIGAWQTATPEQRGEMSQACRKMRLMVSGSAALPVSVWEKWRDISGHALLERYGMTEIGMALSNPLVGERRAGFVGTPLPGVQVRLADESNTQVPEGQPGEIFVSGPAVFSEYWQRPEETEKSFRDGWFITGDMAVVERGSWRILGRKSTDIIKTGGYKVSALEIEDVLLEHPAIAECAVVGVDDLEWGERVAAALVLAPQETLSLEELRDWGKKRLAPYKLPSVLLPFQELPRNAMGKVTKPAVRKLFEN
ncbi:MAG: acyl-CoA synthetase [Deltaproteobacteria bacterium]|nr:acyl-CoA synthetase [Deltaproteobacteria bacterium]